MVIQRRPRVDGHVGEGSDGARERGVLAGLVPVDVLTNVNVLPGFGNVRSKSAREMSTPSRTGWNVGW